MRMRYLVAVALLVTLTAQGQVDRSEGLGSATGVVLDSSGSPLAEATVYALPEKDMTKQIRTTSDSSGHFTLRGIPAGAAYLHAYKETDGYPYNFFSFFKSPGERTPVKIKIAAGKVTSNVVLQMGLRAAYLQFDIANDDGAPVDGELSFDRQDIRGPYRRGVSAGELLMVPPVPFRLTFKAPGYLPWHYGGQRWQGNEGFIRLKSGETLRVPIRLRHSS
jgi:carboxypeptidase family protein